MADHLAEHPAGLIPRLWQVRALGVTEVENSNVISVLETMAS